MEWAESQIRMGIIISGVFLAVILGVLIKVLQISADVTEMKEVLRDVRRNTEAPLLQPTAMEPPSSEENLMRAVAAIRYEDVAKD
jgi:hypothetical protein